MFPQRNIHEYTWTSSGVKTHSHIDHILVDSGRYSSVQSFRAADCNTKYSLVVTKMKARLTVNKDRSQRFRMESKEQSCVRPELGLQLWKIWV